MAQGCGSPVLPYQGTAAQEREATPMGEGTATAAREPPAGRPEDVVMDVVVAPSAARPEGTAMSDGESPGKRREDDIADLEPSNPRPDDAAIPDLTWQYPWPGDMAAMASPRFLVLRQNNTATLDSTVMASAENTAIADMAALAEMDPLAPGLEGTAIVDMEPPTRRPDDTAISDPTPHGPGPGAVADRRMEDWAVIASPEPQVPRPDNADLIAWAFPAERRDHIVLSDPEDLALSGMEDITFELEDTFVPTTRTLLTCLFCGNDADASDPGGYMCDEILEGALVQCPYNGGMCPAIWEGL